MANYLIKIQSNKMAMWVNMPRKYILLDINFWCVVSMTFFMSCALFWRACRARQITKLKIFFLHFWQSGESMADRVA